ncbi:unnamed protein product, partial [Ectocarpus sp. 12 AP-2014]
ASFHESPPEQEPGREKSKKSGSSVRQLLFLSPHPSVTAPVLSRHPSSTCVPASLAFTRVTCPLSPSQVATFDPTTHSKSTFCVSHRVFSYPHTLGLRPAPRSESL